MSRNTFLLIVMLSCLLFSARAGWGTEDGLITGRVVDAVSGGGIESLPVFAEDSSGNFRRLTSYTISGGLYAIAVPPGTYKIAVQDSRYTNPWYGGAQDSGSAAPVSVAATAKVENVDFLLRLKGGISGTVKDSQTGLPVANAQITAYQEGTAGLFSTKTDDQGNISDLQVLDGNYRILIAHNSYVTQWYQHAATEADAATVAVTGPTITGIGNIELLKRASISGKITDGVSGNGIGGLFVYAHRSDDTSPPGARTDNLGNYVIHGLENGSYKLRVDAGQSGYLNQWYDSAPDAAAAREIVATAPTAITGIDFILPRSGTISGKVVEAPSGLPLDQVWVRLYGTLKNNTYITRTDAYGEYHFNIPEDDVFIVKFEKYGYLAQWYNLKQSEAEAQSVTVQAPRPVVGINGVLTKPGSIAGRVIDASTGTAVQGARVELYDESNRSRTATSTGSDGRYTLTGLNGGSYKIQFTAPGFMALWYAGARTIGDATLVTVTPPDTTVADVALARLGSISGKVADSLTGSGIQGNITLYNCSTGTTVATRYTETNGAYIMNNLTPGCYKVRFEAYGYLGQWYGGKADITDSLEVTIQPGNTASGIDGLLVRKGGIAGIVLDSVSGEALPGMTVRIYEDATEKLVSTTTTDASGAYSVLLLPDNRYRILFSGNGYFSRYYGETATQNATPVEVKAPAVVQADIVMVRPGSIAGTVTDGETGSGIAEIVVVAYHDASGDWAASTMTDARGAYHLGQLREGAYRVMFDGRGILHSRYLNQWYDGKESWEAATKVTVLASKTTTGINATMVKGGSISGTVSDSMTGAGIAGVQVAAVDSTSGTWARSSTTDSSGRYTIPGLPGGDYRIYFSEYLLGYEGQWFNQKTGMTCADIVHIAQAEEKTGIDALLVRNGSISGRVSEEGSGAALGNAVVLAEEDGTGRAYSALTLSDGSYSIRGLPAGSYIVRFSLSGYVSRRYSTSPDPDRPTPVQVADGRELVGIDASLARGSSISGRVRDLATGADLEGVGVFAYGQDDGAPASQALTDAAGSYTLGGLKSGTYTVMFSRDGYLAEWYRSSRSRAEAVPVAVTTVGTAGIDALLEKGGSVSGKVTDDASGSGIAFVRVTAYDTATGTQAATTTTDFTGSYLLKGLPTGIYTIQFIGQWSAMGSYLNSWYKDAPTMRDASPLSVSAPHELTGIDGTLAKGGSIAGRIATNSCPAPEAVQVNAHDASTGEVVSSSWTSPGYSPTFLITGLPSGNYRIEFDPLESGFIRQWYKNGGDAGKATVISISGPEQITGIDALLLSGGGSISGTVTDAAHKGIPHVEVNLYNAFTQALVGTTHTDRNGSYVLKGLNTGSYTVFFENTAQFAGRWFSGRGKKKASIVTVKAPDTVTGIDGVLIAAPEEKADGKRDRDDEIVSRSPKKKRR